MARARHFELLREFCGEVVVSREVYDEIVVAGAGMPGADETRRADWIRIRPGSAEAPPEVNAACLRLGAGERSVICLASVLKADLVLIDEERARRAAKAVGLGVAGSISVLERGAKLNLVPDLRSVYLDLLEQGIRFDVGLLNQSLGRLGFPGLAAR